MQMPLKWFHYRRFQSVNLQRITLSVIVQRHQRLFMAASGRRAPFFSPSCNVVTKLNSLKPLTSLPSLWWTARDQVLCEVIKMEMAKPLNYLLSRHQCCKWNYSYQICPLRNSLKYGLTKVRGFRVVFKDRDRFFLECEKHSQTGFWKSGAFSVQSTAWSLICIFAILSGNTTNWRCFKVVNRLTSFSARCCLSQTISN